MGQKTTNTGIPAVGDVPWGTHFCLFYQTEKEMVDILVPYFKAGLESNERCLWITAEPLGVQNAKTSLKKVVKDLDTYIEKAHLQILDYGQLYTESGAFVGDRVLKAWVEKGSPALQGQSDGLRLAGPASWLKEVDWRDFAAYEAALDDIIGTYRMIGICAYSLNKCQASRVIEVINHHQFALTRRKGEWGLVASPGRKRAQEEISHRCRQLAVINEVGRRIAPIVDLPKLYQTVVEAVQEKSGYDWVAIFSVQEDNVALEAVAGPRRELMPSGYAQKLGEGMVGWVAQTGEALLANDVTKEPRFVPVQFLDIASELDVPINLGGPTMGVLAVGSERPDAFADSDVIALQTIANQVAQAMGNARLYQEERRRTHELSVLLDTAQAIGSSLDLEQVLETIASQAKALTQGDGSRIYLLEPDEETLKAFVVLEDDAEKILAAPVPIGQGIIGQVAATGVPDILNHAARDPRPVRIPGRSRKAECLMCAPLVVKGKVIGVMTLSRGPEKGFKGTDLRLLSSLASQAATAIENARLYEETKRLAATDPLTGVWNRRHIRTRLDTEKARARRFGHDLSVLVMDIDNLKLLNDTYGHRAGDEVIRQVARVLLSSCREIDIVGRYGGDEFAVILPEAGAQGAAVAAERILASLDKHPFESPDRTKVPVSVSIGAASYPSDTHEVDRLFSLADAGMYKAKVAGGGQFASLTVAPDELPEQLIAPFDVLKGLLITVDSKDHYTFKHSQDVTQRALALARGIGLSEGEMKALETAGQLHDVGKIGVRTDVLRKPGALTPEEWHMIYEHPRLGHMLLHQIPEEENVLQAVLHHHERYDGMGYPDGLSGEAIPLLARILALADAFSAMIADRPYRKALTLQQALDELRRNAGKQFDPKLAKTFIELVERGEIE